ncbi:MAG: RNA-guided endonuclease TnpB family protein [Candidatus Competibacter denitrificans]
MFYNFNMLIQRAYKFRFYPTSTQRKQLAVEFGHARFVWNRCLDLRSKAWEADKTRHNYVSLSRQVTDWKRGEFPWLSDSTAGCLVQTLLDQDKAFKNFFEKRGQYPKFKSRYDRQAVRYQLDQRQIGRTFDAKAQWLKLPKLGALKLRWSQIPAGTPKMATVSKTPCGHYFVSFSCEVDIQPLPLTGQAIGVDLGIKDVAVSSDGWKSGNPRHLKGQLKHLKRQQRFLARKQKGSNRRRRQRQRVARIHARIAAMRQDFLHKTTTTLVRRADVIALEDLNVKGMLKNHHLAGAIADVGMGEFRRQIDYKAAWAGRKVIVVDRWAPTSKTCSGCGSYQQKIPLSVRAWTCPDCQTRHDRDVNAANVILTFATAGNAGPDARGGGQNLSGHESLTPVEARTDAEKFTEADRLERAA